MNCITCNHEHEDNYCPNCGEKSGTKKIGLSSIFEDAFSTITNMDKGFLYNIKTLIINPRKITFDYILGKRKGILNPISFLIIAITLYLIVITLAKPPKELGAVSEVSKNLIKRVSTDVGLFIRSYLKYFWILSIIPLASSLKIAFRKYNFFEHLAISSFIIGQATLVGIVSFLIFKFPLIFDPFVYSVIIWMIYRIFKDNRNKFESLLVSFSVLFLFLIQLILIALIIGTLKYYSYGL